MLFKERSYKRFFIKTILLLLIISGCDDKKEIHSASISITNIKNNDVVYEAVQIKSHVLSEASYLQKSPSYLNISLWVDGVKTNTQNSIYPYTLIWNTNIINDGEYEIKVSLEEDDKDEIFSSVLRVIVDNTRSIPIPAQFDTLEGINGGIQISWFKAKVEDFFKYKLEKATDSTLTNFELLEEKTDILDTTYFYPNWDKLVNQYFKLTTVDTFNYQSQSEIVLFEKDSIPNRIEISSVSYDTSQLIIKWFKSNEKDFSNYNLLSSDSPSSQKEIIGIIDNIGDTTYTLYDFNPNYLRYFWIEVEDTLGQLRLSSPATYSINTAPSKVNVFPITYNLDSLEVRWEPSNEYDFISYEILRSDYQFSGYSEYEILFNINDESIIIDDYDPTIQNWFKIRVNDFWGLSSDSDPVSNEIDTKPDAVEIESVDYNLDSLTVKWSMFEGDDFFSYEIYQSLNDTNNYDLIYTIENVNDHSYSIQEFDPTIQNWFKIKAIDHWGLTSFSSPLSNQVDLPPINSEFDYIHYENGSLNFSWYQNDEFDFKSYHIYKSSRENFLDSTLVESFYNRNDTTFIIDVPQGSLNYYKIQVTDFWEQTSMGNPMEGNSYTTFIQAYGGVEVDYGKSVIQTNDKSYIVCGTTNSQGSGSSDVFVLKADSLGLEQWIYTFGGFNADYGNQIIEDINGGYVFIGTTQSFGSGLSNIFVSKISENGIEEWSHTYGGSELENGNSIYQVDDGYIIAGSTESFGEGQKDVYVLKINNQGITEWTKTFGTNKNEYATSIISSSEGGYYILANNEQEDMENIYDISVLKINLNGELEWEEVLGGIGNDVGNSIIDTEDGILVSGNTTSYGSGLSDAYFVKLNYSGGIIWENTFGSTLIEKVSSSIKLINGSFIFIGSQESNLSNQGYDIWLGKINTIGELEWSKNYGQNNAEHGYGINLALDGGFIVTGDWNGDIFLLKTDRAGSIVLH